MSKSLSRSSLSAAEYAQCVQIAADYVARNKSISNRELREAAGISYDQAIYFFKRATEEKRLFRKGKGSGTHYVEMGAQ